MLQKMIEEVYEFFSTQPSPLAKKFNAVCSVAGGLFLCFWGGLVLVCLGPSLSSIPELGGTELLYIVACLIACVIVFMVGATLILQSKTPRIMKRCFYGLLSFPVILFGVWMGMVMVSQFGFNIITLPLTVACTFIGINWARLAVRGEFK